MLGPSSLALIAYIVAGVIAIIAVVMFLYLQSSVKKDAADEYKNQSEEAVVNITLKDATETKENKFSFEEAAQEDKEPVIPAPKPQLAQPILRQPTLKPAPQQPRRTLPVPKPMPRPKD